MANLKTNYKDYIADGSKKVKLVETGTGTNTYEITDATVYSTEGDAIGASDINAITTAINTNTTNYNTLKTDFDKLSDKYHSESAANTTYFNALNTEINKLKTKYNDDFYTNTTNAVEKFTNQEFTSIKNLSVTNSTPTQMSSFCNWDTKNQYGYKVVIPATGVSVNSIIQNIVMTDTLLEVIAPYIKTINNGLELYTKDATPVTGTIIDLVISGNGSSTNPS